MPENRVVVTSYSPLMHYELQRNTIGDYIKKVMAASVYMEDKAIHQAIIEGAEREGVTDVYLLDRKWVAAALREKMQRENTECWACGSLTMRERLFRNMKAVIGIAPKCCPVCGKELRGVHCD